MMTSSLWRQHDYCDTGETHEKFQALCYLVQVAYKLYEDPQVNYFLAHILNPIH